MKNLSAVLLSVMAIVPVLSVAACVTMIGDEGGDAYELWKSEGNDGSESDFLEWVKEKSEQSVSWPSIFDSAVFESKTAVYDGSEHKVLVTGAPEGTKIVYAGHSATEVGEYRAFAYLENNGSEKVLTTLLKIELAEITNYSFEDTSVTYDGGTHTLPVSDLPVGVSVKYFCGGVPFTGAIDAGEYAITAELSSELYKPLTISAKLTIEKADADIRFAGKTAEYNIAQTHTIAVTGTIPEGASVTYKGADGKAFTDAKIPGNYEITAVVSGGKNYNDAEMKATLTITKAKISKNFSFSNATFMYDGTKKMIYIKGELPADANVRYTNTMGGALFDGRIDEGYTYVTATVSGEYYEEFVLKAQIFIVKTRLDTPVNVKIDDKNNLSWDKDPKAGSYEVAVYSKSDEFIFSANSAADTISFEDVTTCKIVTLLKRQSMYSGEYIVKVRAIPNGTNAGSFAESEYFRLDYSLTEGKLNPPENVRIEGSLLKWDAVPRADYYDISVQFVDDYGNVLNTKDVIGVVGATSMSVDEIAKKTGFGSGNYKFAVFATPTSVAPGGMPAKDIFGASEYSDFTDIVAVIVK